MNKKIKIAIIDYGVGNLYSLVRAFNFLGTEAVISEDPKILDRADGVILPGVGSFEAGMRGLKIRGLTEVVKKIADKNKPMLGICLGAQLMLTEGYEFGVFRGLNIIKGKVVRFPDLSDGEKIPHVGWNTIVPIKNGSWSNTILNSSKKNEQVYFTHSYILKPDFNTNILAETIYGNYTFCSAIKRGNIYGFQFHPEKSGKVGLKLIDSFIKLVGEVN
jgi:glutamine amidotransferase